MDRKSNDIFGLSQEEQRIDIAQKMMSILDEDGQPMYNEDWINQHILGITEEKEKPE